MMKIARKSPWIKKEEKLVIVAPVKKSFNPFGAFIMLKHPFILLSAVISGIAFGCMFAVETIIPELYESHYGFNSWQTGNFFVFCLIVSTFVYIEILNF